MNGIRDNSSEGETIVTSDGLAAQSAMEDEILNDIAYDREQEYWASPEGVARQHREFHEMGGFR